MVVWQHPSPSLPVLHPTFKNKYSDGEDRMTDSPLAAVQRKESAEGKGLGFKLRGEGLSRSSVSPSAYCLSTWGNQLLVATHWGLGYGCFEPNLQNQMDLLYVWRKAHVSLSLTSSLNSNRQVSNCININNTSLEVEYLPVYIHLTVAGLLITDAYIYLFIYLKF